MPKNCLRLVRSSPLGEIRRDFGGRVDIYSKREVLKINRFPLVVFLRKKFICDKSCSVILFNICKCNEQKRGNLSIIMQDNAYLVVLKIFSLRPAHAPEGARH